MTAAMAAVMAAAITGGEDESVVIEDGHKIRKLPRVRLASISGDAKFPAGSGPSPQMYCSPTIAGDNAAARCHE